MSFLTTALALRTTDSDVDCSPGFWKNHQEIWIPASCGELDCNTLLNLLYLKGVPQAGVFKNFAADLINGWAESEDLDPNCDD